MSPPFRYDPYDPSQAAGSIGEMLARAGQPAAQAAQQIAAAQARASEIGGQAWGHAAQQVGQIPQQIQQQQDQQLDHRLKQQEMTARTAALGDQADARADAKRQRIVSVVGRLAAGAKTPEEFAAGLDDLAELGSLPPDVAAHIKQTATTGEWEPIKQRYIDFADQYAKPIDLAKGAKAVSPISGKVIAENPEVPEPGKGAYTINGQRFSATGERIGEPVPKQGESPKAGTPEDWVSRDRRLAVAQNGGQPLTDEQLRAVDAKSLQQFKETNADPDLRAAALAQKNLAVSMAQMQLSQQPTKEQATDLAADLIAHRIAPEQFSTLFSSRGAQGQALKLMVYGEAKKLDPAFNWEQSAAEYALVKSPAFQTTVRYMDSTIESIPRLMQNATKLANGKFRTWNAIVNAGKNEFNATDLKRFKTDAVLVGDEVAKILAGGGTGNATSDAKLKQGIDLMGQTDSVPAMAAAVDEINALIGNRRKALTRGTYLEGASAVPAPTGATPPALTPGLKALSERP